MTPYCLADKNPILLQQKVNKQIKNIDLWVRINKLSLNYAKTNYIVFRFHKQGRSQGTAPLQLKSQLKLSPKTKIEMWF